MTTRPGPPDGLPDRGGRAGEAAWVNIPPRLGSALTFSVDGHDVWSTRDYQLRSKRFAFWVADTSDAVMSSYVVKQ